jgi:MFS family permease
VPFLLMWAPSWNWVLVANAFLGISQGLTWSTTVIMKIDLVGPARRGLAMGLNECAGYMAVAASAMATGWLAARYGIRPQPFYLGVGFVAAGLALSALLVRETRHHAAHETMLRQSTWREEVPTAARRAEALRHVAQAPAARPREVFWRTTLLDRNLSSVSQAGLVNNLNDGMAWGLFPLVFASTGLNIAEVGVLAAIYPATWGVAQLATGAWSDRTGRKPLIVWGMWLQATAIGVIASVATFAGFVAGGVLLGIGTAMVYPTLLAAIGDVAHPAWRASAVGIYRFWRDLGYAIGALLAGLTADAFGLHAAMWLIAALTFASGVLSALRMTETLGREAAGGRISSEPRSLTRARAASPSTTGDRPAGSGDP